MIRRLGTGFRLDQAQNRDEIDDSGRIVGPVADLTYRAERREGNTGCRLLAAPALLCAALTLSSCGNLGKLETAAPTVPLPKPSRAVAQTPASEREHGVTPWSPHKPRMNDEDRLRANIPWRLFMIWDAETLWLTKV